MKRVIEIASPHLREQRFSIAYFLSRLRADRMFVFEDALVDRDRDRRKAECRGATVRCSDGFEIVFAQAGLDLVERFDGASAVCAPSQR